jgi:protein SCO1/2
MKRAAAALLLAACCAGAHQPRSPAELMDALMWNREAIGGPFTLVDTRGRPRSEREFRGKLLLVYFGFTRCADVCPTDLQQISAALERLGAEADEVQPVFITLDPARDTPARLSSYAAAFHPRLLALTGTEEAVQRVADAYRVYYRKVPTGPGEYTIDHAAMLYLLGRDGRYQGFLPPGTPAARIAEVLRSRLR